MCIPKMTKGFHNLTRSKVKALFRKAVALLALGDAAEEDPEAVLRSAAEIDPNDAAIQKELADITRKRLKDREKEKRIAKKMFG